MGGRINAEFERQLNDVEESKLIAFKTTQLHMAVPWTSLTRHYSTETSLPPKAESLCANNLITKIFAANEHGQSDGKFPVGPPFGP